MVVTRSRRGRGEQNRGTVERSEAKAAKLKGRKRAATRETVPMRTTRNSKGSGRDDCENASPMVCVEGQKTPNLKRDPGAKDTPTAKKGRLDKDMTNASVKKASVNGSYGRESKKMRDVSTPDESWWNPRDEDVVHSVKACLHVSYNEVSNVPSCREGQVSEISKWMRECIENRQGNALYLSGVPGTGKTLAAHALVKNAVVEMEKDNIAPPVAISINCMRLQTATDVLNRIIRGFRTAALKTVSGQVGLDPVIQVPEDDGGTVLSGPWGDLMPFDHLKKITCAPVMTKKDLSVSFVKRRRSSVTESDLVKQTGLIFLILDEIDGMLEGKNCEDIMGSLISLAASKGSRLVMIGISNSIDLMQQLVRPGAILHRFNLKPRNIVFPTYLRDQVSRLILERLETLPGPVFDKRAVEFCARKIANGTGDMRRALEAASIAVDIAVKETNTSDDQTKISDTVSMRHMATALNKLSGGIGTSNEHVCTIKKLPVPQQLIMCAVSAMVGESFKARGLKSDSQYNSGETHLMGMKPNQSLLSLPTYRHSASQSGSKSVSHVVTLSEIEQNHKTLCSKIGVEKYSSSEFTTAIEVLATLGLIELTKSGNKTELKRSRVQLKIGEDDVWIALADIPILKNILLKKT